MSRRRTERPVERLRSSWTSTADLEETIAAMFHHEENRPGEPSPPVNLSGGIKLQDVTNKQVTKAITAMAPDKLSDADADRSPVSMTGVPPVNMTVSSPDRLTGISYELLHGGLVDAKCIRPGDTVQSGHTPSEQAVYTAMWRMLGSRAGDDNSREGILPMTAIAARVSISLRNVRRILRSLEQKLAIEVTEYEDKTRSIPRRYRVWGSRPTVERRRQAGYHSVYRNRNLITLARLHTPDKLS